jgi:D-glycero-D-manno-heptose 1,7-bisphosphate phosphatase
VVTSRRAAVFLDRDGVILANTPYADTGEIEAARTLADVRLLDGALDAMAALAGAGYPLFLVSNQPNQAKGKASRADHDAIHGRLMQALADARIPLAEAYYCFHHPDAVVAALKGHCDCRKPSPFFLRQAARDHGIDLARSWMVGDRETDIACGRQAGTRTIRIGGGATGTAADHLAASLQDAVRLILSV